MTWAAEYGSAGIAADAHAERGLHSLPSKYAVLPQASERLCGTAAGKLPWPADPFINCGAAPVRATIWQSAPFDNEHRRGHVGHGGH